MSDSQPQQATDATPAALPLAAAPPGETDGQKPSAVATRLKEAPAEQRCDTLPPFRVLLHNDPINDMMYVVETIVDLTPLDIKRAATVMLEAHNTGVALVLVTHRERAELYVDQFQSCNLKVTIEPAL